MSSGPLLNLDTIKDMALSKRSRESPLKLPKLFTCSPDNSPSNLRKKNKSSSQLKKILANANSAYDQLFSLIEKSTENSKTPQPKKENNLWKNSPINQKSFNHEETCIFVNDNVNFFHINPKNVLAQRLVHILDNKKSAIEKKNSRKVLHRSLPPTQRVNLDLEDSKGHGTMVLSELWADKIKRELTLTKKAKNENLAGRDSYNQSSIFPTSKKDALSEEDLESLDTSKASCNFPAFQFQKPKIFARNVMWMRKHNTD